MLPPRPATLTAIYLLLCLQCSSHHTLVVHCAHKLGMNSIVHWPSRKMGHWQPPRASEENSVSRAGKAETETSHEVHFTGLPHLLPTEENCGS